MRHSEEQKQLISALKSVYDSIQFHGIYAKYTRSITILSKILKLDDPAELHYVMMHLSRLSYLKNTEGTYLWSSNRYLELLGCEEFNHLHFSKNSDFIDAIADDEFQKMETEAYRFHQISTNLIDTQVKGRGQFTCHAKVYPVFNQDIEVIGSLAVLAEVASHQYLEEDMPAGEAMGASALLI